MEGQGTPDWTEIPLNTRTWVLFQVWGHWGHRLLKIFSAPLGKTLPCGSGCAVLAGLFVSQDCSHYWNKIQQQHTAVLQMNLDMER